MEAIGFFTFVARHGEQGIDQVVHGEFRLPDHPPEILVLPQPPRPVIGKIHSASFSVSRIVASIAWRGPGPRYLSVSPPRSAPENQPLANARKLNRYPPGLQSHCNKTALDIPAEFFLRFRSCGRHSGHRHGRRRQRPHPAVPCGGSIVFFGRCCDDYHNGFSRALRAGVSGIQPVGRGTGPVRQTGLGHPRPIGPSEPAGRSAGAIGRRAPGMGAVQPGVLRTGDRASLDQRESQPVRIHRRQSAAGRPSTPARSSPIV